jgi:hypothetical protein
MITTLTSMQISVARGIAVHLICVKAASFAVVKVKLEAIPGIPWLRPSDIQPSQPA